MARKKDDAVDSTTVKIKNNLISKIVKAVENKYGDVLVNSEVVNNKDVFSTPIYGLNICLSGELDSGMNPGTLQLVGESKSFKTFFLLILAKAYLDKHPGSVFVFFDSENGAALEYFEAVGIDPNRVIHYPITSVEKLKIQINQLLDSITRGDKIFIGIDSLGLLASEKEIKDAIDAKETQDMTRARALNSFWRTVVTQIPLLDIPLVVINHAYDTIGGFIPQKVVKGGKGGYLASDAIWMISRAQDKETSGDKKLLGYHFTITIEKSRKVKEKSKVPITVHFETGVDVYSGLLDIAVDGGFYEELRGSNYKAIETGEEFSEAESRPFLRKLVKNQEFVDFVKNKYKLSQNTIVQKDDTTLEQNDDE